MGLIAVIDLGEIPTGQVLDEPPRRPWPHGRWTVAALALVTALSTVAADVPSPRPLPSVMVSLPGNMRVLVDGDRLFVVQRGVSSDGRGEGRQVVAYHLMDLRRLWAVESPLGDNVFGATTVPGTLALTGVPAGRRADDGIVVGVNQVAGPDTVGLDPATGAVLWRHKGFVEGSTRGGRLILSAEPGQLGVTRADSGPGRTLRAVTGTGETVWSYELSAGALGFYRFDGGAVTLLAVFRHDGKVELRDPDTGELVRSDQIAPPEQDETAGRYVEVVGDLLLLHEGSEVLAYGVDRLDFRWRLPLEPGQDAWFSACGAAICLVRERDGLAVIDPNTGRVRWSDSRWTQGFASGGWLMATDFSPRRTRPAAVVVVDPDTGRVERELGHWDAIHVLAGSIVALRFDSTAALVARLDPARGARVIGVVRDVVGASCSVRFPSLLCRRTDSTLGIWRLPD